jgi:hypothetical protein
MSKKPDNKKGSGRLGTGLLLLGLLGAGALAAARSDEWETTMLPPGQTPDGDGWEPMRAVEHTSIYGALKGKPQARVVWKRRKPREPDDDRPRGGGFPGLFRNAGG